MKKHEKYANIKNAAMKHWKIFKYEHQNIKNMKKCFHVRT